MHIKYREEDDGIVERSIHTVKERGIFVPYRNYRKLAMKYSVEGVIYWIDVLPGNNGVSNTIGTAGIFLRRPKPDLNRKRISFGAYEITYVKTKNYMTSRRVTEIALIPSKNQRWHYFMSLLAVNVLTHIIGKNYQ